MSKGEGFLTSLEGAKTRKALFSPPTERKSDDITDLQGGDGIYLKTPGF